MDATAVGVAEEKDDEQGIHAQDIFDRVVLFLATIRGLSMNGTENWERLRYCSNASGSRSGRSSPRATASDKANA